MSCVLRGCPQNDMAIPPAIATGMPAASIWGQIFWSERIRTLGGIVSPALLTSAVGFFVFANLSFASVRIPLAVGLAQVAIGADFVTQPGHQHFV